MTRKHFSIYAVLSDFITLPMSTSVMCQVRCGLLLEVQVTHVTHSTGVAIVGFGVSAQSGHDTASKLTWNVTKSTLLAAQLPWGWVNSPRVKAHAG